MSQKVIILKNFDKGGILFLTKFRTYHKTIMTKLSVQKCKNKFILIKKYIDGNP